MNRLKEKNRLILVTGVSGAGIGTVINTLEDSGFYCMDHLPVEMIFPALRLLESKSWNIGSGVALGIHIHELKLISEFKILKKKLSETFDLQVVYVTADIESLVDRFRLTRRRHPFVKEKSNLVEAVSFEKNLLSPLEEAADIVIDTSGFSPQTLARLIETNDRLCLKRQKMLVTLVSFGFKYGTEQISDSIFDARFLKNPYFVHSLRKKNGLDDEIKSFLSKDEETVEFVQKIFDLLSWLLPKYYQEGKHYFRIGIGCTGGKHRSVFVSEALFQKFSEIEYENYSFEIMHRDLQRE